MINFLKIFVVFWVAVLLFTAVVLIYSKVQLENSVARLQEIHKFEHKHMIHKPARIVTETKDEPEKPMVLFDEVKADLEQAEGRSNKIYKVAGILHGGIGHKLLPEELKHWKLGDPISDEQIDKWFDHDYHIMMKGVYRYFSDYDDYPFLVKLAIANWLYQLGASAPKDFPLATAAIVAKDWDKAADNWLYANTRTKRFSLWHQQTQHRCEQEVNRLRHVAVMEKIHLHE